MSGMDIFNPLKGLCRGVEADILNHLIHHPSFQSPAEITRAIGRSRNETLKCLHGLADAGIITRSKGSGRAYGLFPVNAVGSRLLSFADLPRELAAALSNVAAEHPHDCLSVTLAPEQWSVQTGLRNLVIAVLPANGDFLPRLRHALMSCSRERFGADISILTGDTAKVRHVLRVNDIDTQRWPLCRSTKGAHRLCGLDLIEVLGGTGGI